MGALTLSTRDPSTAIGRPVEELDTPALVVDLDVVDANIARTAEIAQNAGARLRPHIKTHRMLEVARRQIEAGAQGICCAKTGEAEVFADGGIDDIFIANQVVGAAKLRRLRMLADQVRLAVGVDHSGPDQAAEPGVSRGRSTGPEHRDRRRATPHRRGRTARGR